MRITGEYTKPKAFINLSNRGKVDHTKTSLSNDTITRKDESIGSKKIEELKALYKKLTTRAIVFNLEGNYIEVERDLKKLQASPDGRSVTELILFDLYRGIHEFKKGTMKQFIINVNKCLNKIENVDLHYEIHIDDCDKILFEKLVFNTCKSLINEIFSRESSFRSIIPETLQKFERFIRYIISKEHLSAFVYFLTIMILSRKKHIITRDQFIKVFKEKFTISQNTSTNTKVNKFSSFSEVDVFMVSLKEIVNRVEQNVLVNEYLDESCSHKKPDKKMLKSIEVYSNNNSYSPSSRRTIDKIKQTSQISKVSNYQKYIKNIKNKKIRETFTPNPNKTINKGKSVKSSSKYSLENKLSKTNSKKSKVPERDDSFSTNHFSQTNNRSNTKKIIFNSTKPIQFNNLFKGEDASNDKCPPGLFVHIIEKIDSKLNDFDSQIRSFGDHIQDLRNLLSEY